MIVDNVSLLYTIQLSAVLVRLLVHTHSFVSYRGTRVKRLV